MNHLNAGKLSWHVVQTKPQQEHFALEALIRKGYVCFMPTVPASLRSGEAKAFDEPLFARYLFVQLDALAHTWKPLTSTSGVSNLLKSGGRNATLPDAVVEGFRRAGSMAQNRFDGESPAGQIVSTGVFESIYAVTDADARALLLIDILRQPEKPAVAVAGLRRAA